jgi:hypothetical protein
MKKEGKDFASAIMHFKALLKCKEFVVTGSYSLSLMGIITKEQVSDLDIILVDPHQESIDALVRLQESFPAKTSPIPNTHLIAIIDYNGIKIDFFMSDLKDAISTIKLEDFSITTLDHVVKMKKGYGRVKDLIQLKNIAASIMTQKEFLDKIDHANEKDNYNQ